MCFIEREARNFILKSREIFPWRETVLRAHRMKSDEKPFFCQIYAIFEKNWQMLRLTDIFLYFGRVLKIFLNPRLSLIVPLKEHSVHDSNDIFL